MGLLSLLPDHLSFIETWIARLFFLLAMLSLGPWLLYLCYDLFLYVYRCAVYYFPHVGGRARGEQRPRAPSLTERSDGHRRQISLPGVTSRRSQDADGEVIPAARRRSTHSAPKATFRDKDD